MKKDRSILLAGTFPPIRRKQEIPLLTPSRRMSAGMLHALGSWAKMKERDTEWLLRGSLAWWGDEERRCPMDSLCGHLLWSHGLLVWESPLIPHSLCILGPPSKKKKIRCSTYLRKSSISYCVVNCLSLELILDPERRVICSAFLSFRAATR